MLTLEVSYRVMAWAFVCLCMVLAGLLLLWPRVIAAANEMSKKWVATDDIEKKLNRTHDVDAKLLSWRKVLGALLILIAVVFAILALR